LVNIGPLTSAARSGIPALEQFLGGTVPWLVRAKPYLGGLVPVINYVNAYRREIAAFFANSTATTQASGLNATQTKAVHYLRISNPINPETLTNYPARLQSNRSNPYLVPGGYDLLAGLPTFAGYLCTSHQLPIVGPTILSSLAAVVNADYFTSNPSGPSCRSQPSLGSVTAGQPQSFPHLAPIP
jgi:phospholipid/cholesterol/gamma-HCH transport system substrate-binding protein